MLAFLLQVRWTCQPRRKGPASSPGWLLKQLRAAVCGVRCVRASHSLRRRSRPVAPPRSTSSARSTSSTTSRRRPTSSRAAASRSSARPLTCPTTPRQARAPPSLPPAPDGHAALVCEATAHFGASFSRCCPGRVWAPSCSAVTRARCPRGAGDMWNPPDTESVRAPTPPHPGSPPRRGCVPRPVSRPARGPFGPA